jgi:hypothetical protein
MLADDARDELVGRAVVHHHTHLRMRLAEAPDRRRHQKRGQGRRDGQADAAALQLRELAEIGRERIDVAQDALGRRQHVVGRGRRLQRARGAVKEPRAQALLELADQHAHGRLRDVELLGRGAELAQLMHCEEGAQLAERGAELLIHQQKSYFIRKLLIYE